MSFTFSDKVIAKIPKKEDLEVHIKITTVKEGTKVFAKKVNIREFVPSTDTYGKGVVFDVSMAKQVGEALCKVR